jgi:hypothetical protein
VAGFLEIAARRLQRVVGHIDKSALASRALTLEK